jgi:hypothetical protein
MDENLKNEILKTIALTGVVDNPTFNPMVGVNANELMELGKGLPRIKYRLVDKFKLILSQPLSIKALNPFEIRCCLCKKIITYPCWYMEVRYVRNWFHYFVCFDSSNNTKVTARCFRR